MVAIALGLVLLLAGCKNLTGADQGLPAGTPNPTFYNNKAGALGLASEAITRFELALPQYIVDAGLLSDELEDPQTNANQTSLLAQPGGVTDPLDERILPEGSNAVVAGAGSYVMLQNVRAFTSQALGQLVTYDTATADTATQKILRGVMYALEGDAELMLADLFCSGVPLSTLDYQHDFTYHASSTTTQVYQDAMSKEDSALALAGTNDTLRYLALVLKGRALLALDSVAAAAHAVAGVPDAFQYQLPIQWDIDHGRFFGGINPSLGLVISNREGANGLPYRSSGDPRTATTVSCVPTNNNCRTDTLTFPTKYSAALSFSTVPVPVANGIEARLIQAEAALHAGDLTSYLIQLNTARQLSAPGLPVLPADSVPSTDTGGVTLLFRERAYDLFFTGHRQGDLRRLIRQYGRRQDHVYPTGPYLAPGTGFYGTDVTAPIPSTESANPLFHGCRDRNA